MADRYCTACGNSLSGAAKLCSSCGTAADTDAKSPPQGSQDSSEMATGSSATGKWEYDEFSESLAPYVGTTRYSAHVTAWHGLYGGVPDPNMRDPIKRGVQALLDRVSVYGWEPVEPMHPDRLWDAQRITYVYANDFIDKFSGTSRSARLQAVNVNFRRWVPAGAKLPITPGSGSEKAVREALTKATPVQSKESGTPKITDGTMRVIRIVVAVVVTITIIIVIIAAVG